MDVKDYVLIVMFSLMLILIFVWFWKKYFSINSHNMLAENNHKPVSGWNKRRAVKYVAEQVSRAQGDGASGTTITESNSALSHQAFDGINLNPEKKGNLATAKSDKNTDKKNLPDLANESVLNQGHQGQPKINSQGE